MKVKELVPASPSQLAERGVPGDLGQPRPQGGRIAQFLNLSPRRQERFLTGILAGCKIAENSERNPADHRLVSRDNLHERPLIARLGRARQFRITARSARLHLISSA